MIFRFSREISIKMMLLENVSLTKLTTPLEFLIEMINH